MPVDRPAALQHLEESGVAQASPAQEADTFCEECFNLLTNKRDDHDAIHKESFALLKESVAAGCSLCAILHDGWLETVATSANRPVEEVVQRVLSVQADQSTGLAAFDTWVPPIAELMEWFTFGLRCSIDNDDEWMHTRLTVHVSLMKGRLDTTDTRVIPRYVDLHACRQWITDCAETHANCPGLSEHNLPKRIIDVGPPDGSQLPKIVRGGGKKARYVALSHCWGGKEIPVTDSGNLDSRMNAIQWSVLPQTFQDAIYVVRFLGIQYLWIDSLCIVQDDPAEWQEQCPEMVSTYSNASITIAASGSKDAFEGFLHEREVHPGERYLKLKYSEDEEPATVAITPSKRWNAHRSVEDPPVLAKRAWALQERLLSPRVLHFGLKQAYFECNSGEACEGVRYPSTLHLEGAEPRKDTLVRERPAKALYRAWYTLVQDYTRCDLTYGDDKLPALAGLAKSFEHRLQDKYWLGIWRNDMLKGLRWARRREEEDDDLRPRSAIAAQNKVPSWSWVSCDYPVTWLLSGSQLCVDIPASNEFDFFDQPDTAHLAIRGKLKSFAVCKGPAATDRVHLRDAATGKIATGRFSNERYNRGIWLDKPEWMEFGAHLDLSESNYHWEGMMARRVSCLLFCEDFDALMAREWMLMLLEEVGKDAGIATFRRIGVAVLKLEPRARIKDEEFSEEDFLDSFGRERRRVIHII